MSDHIPDAGKMVSDTPRADAVNVYIRTRRDFIITDHQVWQEHGEQLERELNAANERIKRLEDCIEGAWCLIANVSQGDWTRQKPHWQEAAVRWRDNDFHPIMKELSERKAKEAKP